METSFDSSNNPTGGGSNPFMTTPNGPDSVPYQKSGLLLDAGFKQNGTSPSATDLFFLDRPNGKENSHHHHYDDDDFGPETDVDAVDDVLLSPTKIAASEEEEKRRRLEADLELQRQQMSEFDPVQERREETPTPPADDVPGVGNLAPEADNVAESGDDSEEDEWDYFRVDPKGAGAEQPKQSDQPICDKPAQPEGEGEEQVDDSMSQLNPNAAEFVPSPTQVMPTMNDILLAESPRKGGVPMEDILIPSQNEFQEEVKLRPSEMDLEPDSPTSPKAKAGGFPDLVNKESTDYPDSDVAEKNIHNLENGAMFREYLEQQEISFQKEQQNLKGMMDTMFDKSELSSTKAEFGDDSTVSFVTSGSEIQKTVTENASTFSIMDKSFTEQEFASSDLSSSVSKYDQTGNEEEKELSHYGENEICEKDSYMQNDIVKNLEDMPPMSFEVHKEMVPEMESKPERVQLSEGTSSFEQDETSSPLQAEDNSPPATFETEMYTSEQKHSETEQYEQQFFTESNTFEEVSKNLSVEVKESEPLKLEPMLGTESIDQKIEDFDVGVEESREEKLDVQQKEIDMYHGEMDFMSEKISKESKEFDSFANIKQTESTSESIEERKEMETVTEVECVKSTEYEVDVNKFEAVEQKDAFGTDDNFDQNKAFELEHEAAFVKHEDDFVLDEKLSSPEEQVSPLSPSFKVSSPIPVLYTATSTPETVPIGKETSPLAGDELQQEIMSPSREVSSPVSLEDEMIIKEGPSPVLECFSSSQISQKIVEEPEPVEPERIVEEAVTVESNVPESLNKPESPCLAENDAKSPEPVEAVMEEQPLQMTEALVTETSPVEEDVALIHTPPPTPAHISEEALQESLAAVSPEPQQLSEAAEKLAEKVAEVEPEKVEDTTTTAAVAATAATIGAVAVGAAALATEIKPTEEAKPKVEEKKEAVTEVKKTTTSKDKKTPVADKTKAPAKPSAASKTSTTKTPPKLGVTSPTKPSAATTPRTSTPKKPAAPTSATAARTTPKTTAAPASKPKSATPALKPLPATTKSASPSPRPRPASATSKPLTNGEAKPAPKRTEPLATKKLATTTTARPSRPASAPVAAKTTTTTTTKTTVGSRTATSTAPKPKPPTTTMNGMANKPRPAGALTTATARAKTLDKQVKETANKQISSNRTTTTASATKTANSVASRTLSATATKKTVGPVKSTVTSSTTTKTTAAGKTGVKKMGSTTTTRVTATKSVNKTASSVSEVIQVQQIVTETKD